MDPIKAELIVRLATDSDIDGVYSLAVEFATSFDVNREEFESVFDAVLAEDALWLGVMDCDGAIVGYLLGLDHPTFFANGRVSWVEEIMVRDDYRQRGVGRALMSSFEDWAFGRGSRLIALATRRASGFYESLGYAESASYFRKLRNE